MTDLPPEEKLARFERAIAAAEPAIPLAEAALLAADYLGPACDPAATLARLDALARELSSRLAAPAGLTASTTLTPITGAPGQPARVRRAAVALADLLHREAGLTGNPTDYYDPLNSHLAIVLERGVGIPITLSIVYLEVARRAGLEAVGVGFPGHFLVGLGPDSARLLLDPFHDGRIVTRGELMERFRRQLGPDAPFDPACLRPVTTRQILYRMLNNLKAIHARAGPDALSLRLLELLVALAPDQPEERRDRGLLRMRLGQPAAALADLEFYLAGRPDAEDRAALGQAIERLRLELARWN